MEDRDRKVNQGCLGWREGQESKAIKAYLEFQVKMVALVHLEPRVKKDFPAFRVNLDPKVKEAFPALQDYRVSKVQLALEEKLVPLVYPEVKAIEVFQDPRETQVRKEKKAETVYQELRELPA